MEPDLAALPPESLGSLDAHAIDAELRPDALDADMVSWLDRLARASGSLWWLTTREALTAGARGLSAFTGLPEAALLGAGWLNALAEQDRATMLGRWRASAGATAPLDTACRFVHSSGSAVWLTVHAQALRPASDGSPRWLWVASQTAHERAALSMDHYRSLFDQTTQGLLLIGAQGLPARANSQALHLLGLTLEQARGATPLPAGWRVLCDGVALETPFQAIAQATADGRATQFIWRVNADGWDSERWLNVTCNPIIRAQAALRPRTLVLLTDLTDRAQAHFAIRATAEKSSGELATLRAALDRMTDAFVVLDFAGRFVYLNAVARQQFAPDGDDLLGKRFWDAFPSLAGSDPHAEFERMLSVPTPNIIETQVESGEWYEFRGYPSPEGISVYIRNVTQQKQTMEALDAALFGEREARADAEQRAQQLAAIFEAVGDAMMVVDADGATLQVNAAMRELLALFGLGAAENLNGEVFTGLLQSFGAPGQSGRSPSEFPLQRILAGETLTGSQTVDLPLRTPTGRDISFNVSGAPIHGHGGRILGAVVSLRDVTSQREVEQERNRTLSLVAHELRTPLTAIKLSLDLVTRRLNRGLALDASALDVAMASCLQLERMAGDLVETARAERERMEIERVDCDVRELAAQSVAELGTVTDTPIVFESPDIPLLVTADPLRIRQVFTNLLSNAIKYSPVGAAVGLTLELRDGSVWCGVTDEGQGVPAEAAPHLFEAFYRAPNVESPSGAHAGLGLGLFLCKRIVELHGGQIGMQRRKGRGSLFWFTLPLRSSGGPS